MALAGELLDGSDLVPDAISTYTPDWDADTTAPTNWSSSGWYVKLGPLYIVHALFTPGSGFTAGSGNYRFELPDSVSTSIGLESAIGTGIFRDSSGSTRHSLTFMPISTGSDYAYALYDDGSGRGYVVDHNSPVAPANGDKISLHAWIWID